MCPNDDKYELDSDFEDEEDPSSLVDLGASSLPCERNLAVALKGRSSIPILSARAYLDAGQANNRNAALKDPGLLSLNWMEVSDMSLLLCGFSITSSQ